MRKNPIPQGHVRSKPCAKAARQTQKPPRMRQRHQRFFRAGYRRGIERHRRGASGNGAPCSKYLDTNASRIPRTFASGLDLLPVYSHATSDIPKDSSVDSLGTCPNCGYFLNGGMCQLSPRQETRFPMEGHSHSACGRPVETALPSPGQEGQSIEISSKSDYGSQESSDIAIWVQADRSSERGCPPRELHQALKQRKSSENSSEQKYPPTNHALTRASTTDLFSQCFPGGMQNIWTSSEQCDHSSTCASSDWVPGTDMPHPPRAGGTRESGTPESEQCSCQLSTNPSELFLEALESPQRQMQRDARSQEKNGTPEPKKVQANGSPCGGRSSRFSSHDHFQQPLEISPQGDHCSDEQGGLPVSDPIMADKSLMGGPLVADSMYVTSPQLSNASFYECSNENRQHRSFSVPAHTEGLPIRSPLTIGNKPESFSFSDTSNECVNEHRQRHSRSIPAYRDSFTDESCSQSSNWGDRRRERRSSSLPSQLSRSPQRHTGSSDLRDSYKRAESDSSERGEHEDQHVSPKQEQIDQSLNLFRDLDIIRTEHSEHSMLSAEAFPERGHHGHSHAFREHRDLEDELIPVNRSPEHRNPPTSSPLSDRHTVASTATAGSDPGRVLQRPLRQPHPPPSETTARKKSRHNSPLRNEFVLPAEGEQPWIPKQKSGANWWQTNKQQRNRGFNASQRSSIRLLHRLRTVDSRENRENDKGEYSGKGGILNTIFTVDKDDAKKPRTKWIALAEDELCQPEDGPSPGAALRFACRHLTLVTFGWMAKKFRRSDEKIDGDDRG